MSLNFYSCKTHRSKPDIENIKINLKVLRFEKDLFNSDFERLNDSISYFRKVYGEFFDVFNYKVIRIGGDDNPNYPVLLKGFVTDYNMNQAWNQVNKIYNDFSDIESKLNKAFTYFKYYFPQVRIPVVVTYISGFNQSMVTTDSLLGIGLDKYLGKGSEFYNRLGWPKYLQGYMVKERIPVDCIHNWIKTQFDFSDSVSNLLSNIVYEGKLMYATNCMFPDEEDSIISGFSEKQLQWCKGNESAMWTYLVENKLLFKSDYLTINKFIGEGPYTKDFGRESPAKACIWIGWQIINAYMENRPNVSLQELMQEKDNQKILRLSKYKP